MSLYKNHDHKAFCRDALFVQDACNLRAIARLLVAAADYATDNFGGTDASYCDPAVVLIVNKLESLVHSNWNDNYSLAYDACKRIGGD